MFQKSWWSILSLKIGIKLVFQATVEFLRGNTKQKTESEFWRQIFQKAVNDTKEIDFDGKLNMK